MVNKNARTTNKHIGCKTCFLGDTVLISGAVDSISSEVQKVNKKGNMFDYVPCTNTTTNN